MNTHAKLIKVRVPFHKSVRAWQCPDGHIVRVGGSGPMPPGAVVLDDKGTMLDIQTGRIYTDARFVNQGGRFPINLNPTPEEMADVKARLLRRRTP